MGNIKTIYFGGAFIPVEKVNVPERAKVVIKIEKVEALDEIKMYSYMKLLREGEDARKLFEF